MSSIITDGASFCSSAICCFSTISIQAVKPADSESIFEKVFLVVVTFLLTTVIGAFWTSFLNATSWKRQTRVDLFRKRYDEGTKFLDEISLLIGKRFFLLQRLFWAIQDAETDKISKREDDYFRAVGEWNHRFWLNRNKIRLLVSNSQAEDFLDYRDDHRKTPQSLHYCFVRAHRCVLAAKDDEAKISEAEAVVTDLSHRCSRFLESLTFDFLVHARSLELIQVPKADALSQPHSPD